MLALAGNKPLFFRMFAYFIINRSFANNVYNPHPGVVKTAPSSNNYEGGFPLSHMRKDLSLAISAADSKGANLDTVKFTI